MLWNVEQSVAPLPTKKVHTVQILIPSGAAGAVIGGCVWPDM